MARLHAVNGKLNAVTVDLSESARQAAADIDKARARGEKLPPLAGASRISRDGRNDVPPGSVLCGLPRRRSTCRRLRTIPKISRDRTSHDESAATTTRVFLPWTWTPVSFLSTSRRMKPRSKWRRAIHVPRSS